MEIASSTDAEGSGKSRTRKEALVHLLADEDSGIRHKVWRYLEKMGDDAIGGVDAAAGDSVIGDQHESTGNGNGREIVNRDGNSCA